MVSEKINILITRPQQSLHNARALLPAKKFAIHPFPTIEFSDVDRTLSLDNVMRKFKEMDFVIFTSQVAVTKTINYLRDLNLNTLLFNNLCVCAVGSCTAQLLRSYGITAQLIPENYTAQSLLSFFPSALFTTPKIMYPRSNISSTVLIETLTRKGYEVCAPIIYCTDYLADINKEITTLIKTSTVDCIAFTSPSSVKSLIDTLGADIFHNQLANTKIAVIGPTTAQACKELDLLVSIQPNKYTLQSLSREIAHFFNSRT